MYPKNALILRRIIVLITGSCRHFEELQSWAIAAANLANFAAPAFAAQLAIESQPNIDRVHPCRILQPPNERPAMRFCC